VFLRKAPVATIANEKRGTQKKVKETPGPAHYQSIKYTNAGPKFVIGIKSQYDVTGSNKKNTPGVGSYNPGQSKDASAKVKHAPKFSFGREARKGIPTQSGPAPNQYSPDKREKYRAPRPFIPQSMRLGSAPHGQIRKGRSMTALKLSMNEQRPGPGAYYLPATFANSKGYELGGSNQFQRV